jgi:hypothetical protein
LSDVSMIWYRGDLLIIDLLRVLCVVIVTP